MLHVVYSASKAAAVLRDHRVSFQDASQVFSDPNRIEFHDNPHSSYEDRYKTIGLLPDGKLICLYYTVRGQYIRLITVRKATKEEEEQYFDASHMNHYD